MVIFVCQKNHSENRMEIGFQESGKIQTEMGRYFEIPHERYQGLNERNVNKDAEDRTYKKNFSNIEFIRLGYWFHGRLEDGMRKRYLKQQFSV